MLKCPKGIGVSISPGQGNDGEGPGQLDTGHPR
jgi:hypothetical protein